MRGMSENGAWSLFHRTAESYGYCVQQQPSIGLGNRTYFPDMLLMQQHTLGAVHDEPLTVCELRQYILS
jgi:hypothetical protein